MSKMKCIIVDDEALAREGIEQYVGEIAFLELTGSYKNALAAQNALQNEHIDLMFLDINMPKMTGLSFLETLSKPPITIITTAYPDYALEGFRLHVLDYLLKPIPLERFIKSVNKAHDYYQLLQKTPVQNHQAPLDYIFLKHSNLYEKVMLADIVCVEAMQNYVLIHTVLKKIIVHLTFKSVEESLPTGEFFRVHKSFLISVAHIKAIEGNTVLIHNKQIPISRSQREELMQQVVNRALLTKEGKK
jgi:two-component system, LytTR family, response regulator